MTELKPCPFCGGEVELEYDEYNHALPCCNKCVYFGPHHGNITEAIAAWNRRASNVTPTQQLLAAAVEWVEAYLAWQEGEPLPSEWLGKELAAWLSEAERRASGWIRAEDGLPEQGHHVLVWVTDDADEPYAELASWCESRGGYWIGAVTWGRDEVTHWMPLPEPPDADH